MKRLDSRGKSGCNNLMTDFNENYALLCAMVDAVIALQVQVIIEDVFQKLVFFFF